MESADVESKEANKVSFVVPQKIKCCIGKKTECLFVNFEDFQKLIPFSVKTGLSTLAIDLLKTITGGVLDLKVFETHLADFRNPSKEPFNKTLNFKFGFLQFEQQALDQRQEVGEIEVFKQKHEITSIYMVVANIVNGKYNGFTLRQIQPKKKKLNFSLTKADFDVE